LVAVLAFLALWLRALDSTTAIASYRIVDDHTVVIRAVSGPGRWTRVTGITETATQIIVAVSSLRAPLPSAGGNYIDLTVSVHDSIGGRQVIDASSGKPPPFPWEMTEPASPTP
jgi:hypothetical protein